MVAYINFHTLATLCAGLALGAMVMFSFVLAPLLFRKLGADVAAEFMRSAFPAYYALCGLLSALAGALVWYRMEAILLGLVAALFALGYFVLLPMANRLRAARAEGDAAAAKRFGALHRTSVALNMAQLAALLVAFMRLAA